MFNFLGNGFTITEEKAAKEGKPPVAAYIRLEEDETWDIE